MNGGVYRCNAEGEQADISRQEEVFSYCVMTVCGLPEAEVIQTVEDVHCVVFFTYSVLL